MDFNNDCIVDTNDLSEFVSKWLTDNRPVTENPFDPNDPNVLFYANFDDGKAPGIVALQGAVTHRDITNGGYDPGDDMGL